MWDVLRKTRLLSWPTPLAPLPDARAPSSATECSGNGMGWEEEIWFSVLAIFYDVNDSLVRMICKFYSHS
jgi:hypothetical protein